MQNYWKVTGVNVRKNIFRKFKIAEVKSLPMISAVNNIKVRDSQEDAQKSVA